MTGKDNPHGSEDQDEPTIEEMEEVNMTNLKRLITLPTSMSMLSIIALAGLTIAINVLSEAFGDLMVEAFRDSAPQLIFGLMMAMMLIIAASLTSATGELMGIRVLRGEKNVSTGFRVAIALTQAAMIAGAVGLYLVMPGLPSDRVDNPSSLRGAATPQS